MPMKVHMGKDPSSNVLYHIPQTKSDLLPPMWSCKRKVTQFEVTYLLRILGQCVTTIFHWNPYIHLWFDSTTCKERQVRMRLHLVDYIFVTLYQTYESTAFLLPDEYMATIWSTNNIFTVGSNEIDPFHGPRIPMTHINLRTMGSPGFGRGRFKCGPHAHVLLKEIDEFIVVRDEQFTWTGVRQPSYVNVSFC